jgi:asparagine synthase (glutamine-hydrolysing)
VCGIVAVFARDGAELDPRRVVAMRDSLTHRGPDDAGMWTRDPHRNVALAVRRLAIEPAPSGKVKAVVRI